MAARRGSFATARQACRDTAASFPPDPCRIPMVHSLAFGGSTPWSRTRCSLSRGTSAASPTACARPTGAHLLGSVAQSRPRDRLAHSSDCGDGLKIIRCHPGGARDRANPYALGAEGPGATADTGLRANAAGSLIACRHSSRDELSCRRSCRSRTTAAGRVRVYVEVAVS
jgi:hypothetical protein